MRATCPSFLYSLNLNANNVWEITQVMQLVSVQQCLVEMQEDSQYTTDFLLD